MLSSTAALIDRLVHHSQIVNIRGYSYRMRKHADLAQLIQRSRDTTTRSPHTQRPAR